MLRQTRLFSLSVFMAAFASALSSYQAKAEPLAAPSPSPVPAAVEEAVPVVHHVPKESLEQQLEPKVIGSAEHRLSAGYGLDGRINRDPSNGLVAAYRRRVREFPRPAGYGVYESESVMNFPSSGYDVNLRYTRLRDAAGTQAEVGYIPGSGWQFTARAERAPVMQRVALDVGKVRGHYERNGESAISLGVCAESSPRDASDLSLGAAARIRFNQRATESFEFYGNFQACIGQGIGKAVAGDKTAIGSFGIEVGAIVRLNRHLFVQGDWKTDYRSSLRSGKGEVPSDRHIAGKDSISEAGFVTVGTTF